MMHPYLTHTLCNEQRETWSHVVVGSKKIGPLTDIPSAVVEGLNALYLF